jgi:hypothetical protein
MSVAALLQQVWKSDINRLLPRQRVVACSVRVSVADVYTRDARPLSTTRPEHAKRLCQTLAKQWSGCMINRTGSNLSCMLKYLLKVRDMHAYFSHTPICL